MAAIRLRSFYLLLLFLGWQPALAWALDPALRITQYAHAGWRTQDGMFNGVPLTIAQTPDGYIWIGTTDGVVQFDGTRFVPWAPGAGQRLPTAAVYRLRTAPDGSVWLSVRGYLSRWKDGTLASFATRANAHRLADDGAGTLWAGLASTPGRSGALCRLLSSGPQCLDSAAGLPTFRYTALMADRDGAIWIGGDTSLVRWAKGIATTYPLPSLAANAGMEGILALAATPDRTLWVGVGKAGPGLGLQRLIDGQWQSFDTLTFPGSTLSVSWLHVDREGALWVGTFGRGLYRISGGTVDHFDATNGLSDNTILDLAEDREGNLWVVTPKGVDRFAETPVTTISAAEGLCSSEASSVLASRDGSIWSGGHGALAHISNGQISCLHSGHDLPGQQVTSLFEDHAGRLWVGLDQGLWVREHDRFQQITRPDARPIGLVTGIAEDDQQRVWIAASGPPRMLMRVEGLAVREDVTDPPMVRRIAGDPAGGLWLALTNGDLTHLRDGKIEPHAFAHPDWAQIHQILPDRAGSVIVAASYGLIGWHDGKDLTLTQRNGLPCEQVYAIAFDRQRNLWLYMNCGLGVLKSADLEHWKQNSAAAVTIQRFDVRDGVRPTEASFVAGAGAVDGRLWFANSQALQVVDPGRFGHNTVPPPVHVEQVLADRVAYPVAGALHLPPRTRDLEIDYVGLSFVVPQKVRFRYRLDGRDDAWQEPGTRRQAFYTDLRPGAYRFRVIASNNDGVWNEQGASLEIVITPAWYQTRSFVAAIILLGGLAVWVAVYLRMRRMARVLAARFDERLAERTRMARDLHDTMLQTLQGSQMVAETAMDRPDDAATLLRALQQVSTWLGKAIEEGRAAVNALRASTTEGNSLAEAFQRAIEDCQRRGTIHASLAVTGEPREMHPIVRDEVYRIGYEAIRNACIHSKGSHLRAHLTYGRDLDLRITDDGVGMESTIAEQGRAGHFGLPGMRERALRIGAAFSITTAPGAGTAIVVTVPGRVIFRKS